MHHRATRTQPLTGRINDIALSKEASEKSRDVNALAGICNSKVEKLAEICNIGVGEMADLMNKNGDDYSKYEEWAKKLQGVYATQSKEIQDAYTSIATGQ